LGTLLLALLTTAVAWAGDVPVAQEPIYVRATLEFNGGKFDEALRLAEQVLSAAPAAFSAMELKALCLKAKGDDEGALRVYGDLIRNGEATSKPKYYFEVAQILYGAKRYAQAAPYFHATIAAGFNRGASHYFLGIIDYQDKQWEAAELHLLETLASTADDLKPYANLYLGLIYYRTGYSIGAIRGLRAAREAVEPWKKLSEPERKDAAETVSETVKPLLKQLDRVRWFGEVATMTEYDNNATLLPPGVNVGAGASSQRTARQVFTGTGGLVSSPSRMFQAIVAYRSYFNYNYNADTKNFDFFSHLPSINVNYKPYLRLTPGAKIEGNYTFQNAASRDTSIEFHPYLLSGEMGPYLRYEVNPHLWLEGDAFYKPIKYFGEADVSLDRRSGDGYIARAQVEYVSPSRFLAPTGYFSYEDVRADGANWQYYAWSLGFSNLARFDSVNQLFFSFDVSFPRFSARVPVREDAYLATKLRWIHALTRHFSFLTEFNYVSNRSTLEGLFSYNRAFGGAGLSYTF
jgi:tetratricopeptide (TPR) repeat protein